jgi:hypothetical protein
MKQLYVYDLKKKNAKKQRKALTKSDPDFEGDNNSERHINPKQRAKIASSNQLV